MKLKNAAAVVISSVALTLFLAPIAAFSLDVKYVAACVSFTFLTAFFIRKLNSQSGNSNYLWVLVLLLLIPPSAILLPLHFNNIEATSISFPSTIAHYLGILLGLLASQMGKKYVMPAILLTIGICIWIPVYGKEYWWHFVKTKHPLGFVDEVLPIALKLYNSKGEIVDADSLKGKIIVLDFWTTTCKFCFVKFPELQDKYAHYMQNDKVEVLSVNVPLPQDTAGKALSMIHKYGYSFPVFFMEENQARALGVVAYPEVLILYNNQILFKGDISMIDYCINSLL